MDIAQFGFCVVVVLLYYKTVHSPTMPHTSYCTTVLASLQYFTHLHVPSVFLTTTTLNTSTPYTYTPYYSILKYTSYLSIH